MRLRMAWLALALWALACGGKGCGSGCAGGAGPADAGPGTGGPADAGAAVPSPAPSSVAALEAFGNVLPVQLRWAAVFPARWIADEAQRLPEAAPKLVRAPDAPLFARRVQELYGLELAKLRGMCVVAEVVDAGPVAVCDGGALVPVEGARRWEDGEAKGIDVSRGDVTISVAMLKDRVVAGQPDAVRRVVQTARRQWPSLRDSADRWKRRLADLDAADAWHEGALFFLDPGAAPWCIPGDCLATAGFASRAAFSVAVQAEPGRVDMARMAAERAWQSVVVPFGTLRDLPADERPMALPDELFKGGDGAVRSGVVSVRGERVTLSGQGDLLRLAELLRLDVVRLLVGKVDGGR